MIGEFFQLGYVTKDLDGALKLYRERYDVAEFLRFNSREFAPPGAAGPFIEVALAYAGPVMIELIQPDPGDPGVYGDAIRADGGVTLHHLGYLVDDGALPKLVSTFRRRNVEVPVELTNPAMALIYADTRSEVGLFSEYVCLNDDGRRFFGQVPHNATTIA